MPFLASSSDSPQEGSSSWDAAGVGQRVVLSLGQGFSSGLTF